MLLIYLNKIIVNTFIIVDIATYSHIQQCVKKKLTSALKKNEL